MRRLPVIQPTVIERRALLLGLLGTSVAACASEAEPGATQRRPGSSSGGTGSDGGSSADGSVASGGDGGGTTNDSGAPRDAGTTPRDAGAEASLTCATGGYDVGAAPASFAMGTITYVASTPPVYVGRDANGLYAMGALCTHSIGNMQQSNGQLVCLVHGARFSLTGQVLQGPATIDLLHFDVCVNAKGNVAVDQQTIVPASTRLKA